MKATYNYSQIFKSAHKFASHAIENYREYSVKGGYRKALAEGLRKAYSSAKKASNKIDAEALVVKIKSNAGFSAYLENDKIKGCYRGKTSETYVINAITGEVIFDRAGVSSLI